MARGIGPQRRGIESALREAGVSMNTREAVANREAAQGRAKQGWKTCEQRCEELAGALERVLEARTPFAARRVAENALRRHREALGE